MITLSQREVLPDGDGAPSLEDIGVGLGRMPRFAGQTRVPHSVLAHVRVVSQLVAPPYVVDALLHDAGEAVIGDTPATWKEGADTRREHEILRRVYDELRFPYPLPLGARCAVKEADIAALVVEARILGHARPEWFESRYAAGEFGVEPDPELLARAATLTAGVLSYGFPVAAGGSLYASWLDVAMYPYGRRAAA